MKRTLQSNGFPKLNFILLIAISIFFSLGASAQSEEYSKEEIYQLRQEVYQFSGEKKELYIQAKLLFNQKIDAGSVVLSRTDYQEIERRINKSRAKLTIAQGEEKAEIETYIQKLTTRYISTFQIVEQAKKL